MYRNAELLHEGLLHEGLLLCLRMLITIPFLPAPHMETLKIPWYFVLIKRPNEIFKGFLYIGFERLSQSHSNICEKYC